MAKEFAVPTQASDPWGGNPWDLDDPVSKVLGRPSLFQTAAREQQPAQTPSEKNPWDLDATRAIAGPRGQAALQPQLEPGEMSREDQLRRIIGLEKEWRDIPFFGAVGSSVLNLGAGITRGIIDTVRLFPGADTEFMRMWSEEAGVPMQQHQERSAIALTRAFEKGGLPAYAATMAGQATIDVATFLAFLKVAGASKILGAVVPTVKGGAGAAPIGIAGMNFAAAAKMGTYRFVTTPGSWQEKGKAAALSAAYRATPGLSGWMNTDFKAFAVDFMLNSAISSGMGGIFENQYRQAFEQGKEQAKIHGDEENATLWGFANLIPIVGSDLWFSAFTKSFTTYQERVTQGMTGDLPGQLSGNRVTPASQRHDLASWYDQNRDGLMKFHKEQLSQETRIGEGGKAEKAFTPEEIQARLDKMLPEEASQLKTSDLIALAKGGEALQDMTRSEEEKVEREARLKEFAGSVGDAINEWTRTGDFRSSLVETIDGKAELTDLAKAAGFKTVAEIRNLNDYNFLKRLRFSSEDASRMVLETGIVRAEAQVKAGEELHLPSKLTKDMIVDMAKERNLPFAESLRDLSRDAAFKAMVTGEFPAKPEPAPPKPAKTPAEPKPDAFDIPRGEAREFTLEDGTMYQLKRDASAIRIEQMRSATEDGGARRRGTGVTARAMQHAVELAERIGLKAVTGNFASPESIRAINRFLPEGKKIQKEGWKRISIQDINREAMASVVAGRESPKWDAGREMKVGEAEPAGRDRPPTPKPDAPVVNTKKSDGTVSPRGDGIKIGEREYAEGERVRVNVAGRPVEAIVKREGGRLVIVPEGGGRHIEVRDQGLRSTSIAPRSVIDSIKADLEKYKQAREAWDGKGVPPKHPFAGKNISAIAKDLSISRDMVRQILREESQAFGPGMSLRVDRAGLVKMSKAPAVKSRVPAAKKQAVVTDEDASARPDERAMAADDAPAEVRAKALRLLAGIARLRETRVTGKEAEKNQADIKILEDALLELEGLTKEQVANLGLTAKGDPKTADMLKDDLDKAELPDQPDVREQPGRGTGITREQATADIKAQVGKTKGAKWTGPVGAKTSPELGTLTMGRMKVRFVHGEPPKGDASGEVHRSGADYTVYINPKTGQRTTVRHEMNHIMMDALNPVERAVLSRVTGADISNRAELKELSLLSNQLAGAKGAERNALQIRIDAVRETMRQKEESFVELLDGGTARVEAMLRGHSPAERSGFIRAVNKFIEFVNAVLGTDISRIGNAKHFDRLAKDLRDGNIFSQLSEGTRGGDLDMSRTQRAMESWHGTPHTFGPEKGYPHGRFRLDKIGTGEGGQAYGWGIYFGEAKGVAETYQKRFGVSPFDVKIDGKAISTSGGGFTESIARHDALRALAHFGNIEDAVINLGAFASSSKSLDAGLKWILENKDKIEFGRSPSSLYRLDIPDNVIPKLLDYDKPVSEQPKALRDAVASLVRKEIAEGRKIRSQVAELSEKEHDARAILLDYLEGDNKAPGANLYGALQVLLGSKKAASEFLNRAGIPGLRFLDQGSRGQSPYWVEIGGKRKLVSDWDQMAIGELMAQSHSRSGMLDSNLMNKVEGFYEKFDRPAKQIIDIIRGWSRSGETVRFGEDSKTRNTVIWDQPTLDRIALLERNEQALDQIRADEARPAGEGRFAELTGDLRAQIDAAPTREAKQAALDKWKAENPEAVKEAEGDAIKGFHVTKAPAFDVFRDDIAIPSSEGVYFWLTREQAERFKGPNERIVEALIDPGRTTTTDSIGNIKRGTMSGEFDTARGQGSFGEELVVFNMDSIRPSPFSLDDAGNLVGQKAYVPSPDVRQQRAPKPTWQQARSDADERKEFLRWVGSSEGKIAKQQVGANYSDLYKAYLDSPRKGAALFRERDRLRETLMRDFEKIGESKIMRFMSGSMLGRGVMSILQPNSYLEMVSPETAKWFQNSSRQARMKAFGVINQMDDILKQKEFSQYQPDRKVSLDVGGKKIRLAVDQLVSAALYLENPETARTISNWVNVDGERHYWSHASRSLLLSGKKNIDALKLFQAENEALARDSINRALEQLSPNERKVMDLVRDLNNREWDIDGQQRKIFDWLYEVGREYLGKEIVQVKGTYMPATVDIAQGAEVKGSEITKRVLRSAGLMQDRLWHSQGMVLNSAVARTRSNIQQSATVAALVPTIYPMRATLDSMKESVAPVGSRAEVFYKRITDSMDRIEGIHDVTDTAKLKGLLRVQDLSRFSGPTVWVSQLASIPNAAAELGGGRMLKSLLTPLSKKDFNEILKINPVVEARRRAKAAKPEVFEHGLHAGHRPYTKRVGAGQVLDKAAAVQRLMLTPMGMFDMFAIKRVLGASVDWAKSQGLTGKEMYQAASDKAYDVIGKTQPSFLPEHRSMLATEPGYAARIISRYRTMSDSAFNQIMRYAIKAERSGWQADETRQFLGTMAYSMLVPALLLAMTRPVVRRAMRKIEGREVDEENFPNEILAEGLGGAVYAIPMSHITLDPLIKALTARDAGQARMHLQRVQEEGGVFTHAKNIVEIAYGHVEMRELNRMLETRRNRDGSRMTHAQARRHKERMSRRRKRLTDSWGRTFDESTGLPVGRLGRILTRRWEQMLK